MFGKDNDKVGMKTKISMINLEMSVLCLYPPFVVVDAGLISKFGAAISAQQMVSDCHESLDLGLTDIRYFMGV